MKNHITFVSQTDAIVAAMACSLAASAFEQNWECQWFCKDALIESQVDALATSEIASYFDVGKFDAGRVQALEESSIHVIVDVALIDVGATLDRALLYSLYAQIEKQALQHKALAQNPLALNPPFNKEGVEIVSQQHAYQGFFAIDQYMINHKRFAGGWVSDVKRELIVRQPAAAALLYDPEFDCLVMVEQFRIGALTEEQGPWCLEMVAGIADKDESLEELIRREAWEEAGCKPKRIRPIYRYLPSPGGGNESLQLYIAEVDCRDIALYAGLEDEHEDIKTYVIPRAQAMQLMEQRRLGNAASLIALQWLDRQLLKGGDSKSIFDC